MRSVVSLKKGNLVFLSNDENGAQLKKSYEQSFYFNVRILEMHARVFETSQGKASAAVQLDFQNQKC